MKKIYFIIAVGIVVGCATKKCVNSDNLYKIALQKIILEYAADIKNIESSIISNEQIPFNLESTYSGIIERNLIANYDEMMDCDTIQIKHINKVIDSLAAKSKLYNSNFKKNNKINIDFQFGGSDRKTKYVLFFSEINDELLYAELRRYDIKINSYVANSGELSYGKVYSFLFKVHNLQDVKLIADGHYYLN